MGCQLYFPDNSFLSDTNVWKCQVFRKAASVEKAYSMWN